MCIVSTPFAGVRFFWFLMVIIAGKLSSAVVGIAGLGGLGSTVAAALARAGVGRLIIADFDVVEKDNLNRQHYFVDQVGKSKVDATIENLGRINPEVTIKAYRQKLLAADIPEIFAEADVITECFDRADQKQMIVEAVLTTLPKCVVVTVSGLAGYGRSNEIKTRRLSNRLILVGDCESGIESEPTLTAPRVWVAASHQANAVIEVLLNNGKSEITGK